jgi:wyosine [tRNA(Phe)-imidazoG37] synthetase (radical SAM superfamily)
MARHVDLILPLGEEHGQALIAGQQPRRTQDGIAADALATRSDLYAWLMQRQIGRILRLVTLEASGEPVQADAFDVGGRPLARTRGVRVSYETLASYTRHDPVVGYIADRLKRALRTGRFSRRGAPIVVDGFRLRDLAQWSTYPTESLSDNIGSISSYCNCDCEFCFEKNTASTELSLGRAQLSRLEVETRIRHYHPTRRTGLIPSARFSLEPFANPHCLAILERVHAVAPNEVICFTTNGSFLTEDVVVRLARLQPLLVVVSLNSGTVETRRRTMRDHHLGGDEAAFAALRLLKCHEIPYLVSYVPWPSRPLSDMEEMVRLVDENDGLFARICLPSWTRASAAAPPFDTETYWAEIRQVVDELRGQVSLPIHVMPAMYELPTMRPVIHGAIKNSPAARAGLQYGDLILGVDGSPVHTRAELSGLLGMRYDDLEIISTRFTVQRADRVMEVEVPMVRDRSQLAYPYRAVVHATAKRWGSSLGIHMGDGIPLRSFVDLRSIADEYTGKTVLFYISPLAGTSFSEGITMLGAEAGFLGRNGFHVETLAPRYWGGNVVVGDLWTFHDLVEQTRRWIAHHGIRPDVVVAPGTFMGTGGRDLMGTCYLDFERALGIEFRALSCPRIGI